MRKCKFALALVGVLSLLTAEPASAEDWVIVRQPGSGSCQVQTETAAIIGELLPGKYSDQKGACLRAAAIKAADDQPSDRSKCFAYLDATVAGCLVAGVTLPK